MEYFSQVFVLILSTWKCGFIIFLSVIQRIMIFLSAIQCLIIWFLLSASSSYFSSASISRALLFLERFYFSSASIFRALWFLERFYFSGAFISRALLFLFSKCKPALIFYSSRHETVSNCCFKTISYLFIISWIIWLCFKCYF